MEADIRQILLTKEDIQKRVQELGEELADFYAGKNPLLVCVLKGGMPFMADLMQAMAIDLEIDFMAVSSYGDGHESYGEVQIIKDLSISVKDRHVLFVEDIIDTGQTLVFLYELFKTRRATSTRTVALLDKPSRRKIGFTADWVGFEVPDEFLVGYGMDYAESYRNLPYIGILKKEVYQSPAISQEN